MQQGSPKNNQKRIEEKLPETNKDFEMLNEMPEYPRDFITEKVI